MDLTNEYDKMLAGLEYNALDPELVRLRRAAHELCRQFNLMAESDTAARLDVLRQLLPDCAELPQLEGGIFVDYGRGLHIGRHFFAGYGFTANDNGGIYIGDDVLFGPHVSIYTAMYPMRFVSRMPVRHEDGTLSQAQSAAPVRIGDGCRLGGGVSVLPGVTIGRRCVIGEGSTVTHDIPDDVYAAGNPCRVVCAIMA